MKKLLITFASVILLLQGISLASNYSQEYQDAYNYAYNQGITTATSIEKANIYGSLTRIAMAKMISNFAINVLGIVPDSSLNCSFADVTDEMDAGYGYGVKKACQLGLMGIGSNGKISANFNPKGTVMRGQRATIFSRALSKYNGDTVKEISPYYKSHLEYLHSKGIINNIESPTAKSVEKRGNVMLMMYRVSRNVKNYQEGGLIGGFEKEFKDENKLKNENPSENKNSEKSDNKEEKISDNDNSKSIVYRRVNNSYKQFLTGDFNAVEDVYKNIKTGDRVIFLVRHSERITDCTAEGGLTERGTQLAQGVGEKLKGAPFQNTSTDFYGSSVAKRTVQTSYYVGESRGSKVLKNPIDSDNWSDYEFVNHSDDINSVVYGEYFTDGNSYLSIESLYEENKDSVKERVLAMVTKLCELTQGHPFSWITSHDWVVLPLTEWATNETLSFSETDSEWPNFMQGIAIIVHKDGGWEIYPVKSLESGKMKARENPGC